MREPQQKVSSTEILGMALNGIALEMSAKLDAARPVWEPQDHSFSNWASEISHPCLKHLVHCRVDWRQRQPMEIEGRWRVDEGLRIEWETKKWLGDIGYEVTKSQRKFNTEDPGMEEFCGLQLTCKIDGMSPLNRELPEPFARLREIPIEVKTVNPNYWPSTKMISDIKTHKKFWITKMPEQLNIGIALSRNPGGLLIVVTFGKKPRILPMLFDPDLWQRTKSTCHGVNAHMKAGTYPAPIPFDATVCGMCDFNHLCQPVKMTTASEIDPMDKFKFEIYLEAKEWRDRFNELHAELIGDKRKPGKYHGKEGILEDIIISTNRYMKKVYRIPPEVKEQYRAGEDEVVVTTIERMEK